MDDILITLADAVAACRVRQVVAWEIDGPAEMRGLIATTLIASGYRVELRHADETRFGLTVFAPAASAPSAPELAR
jgi:hypothetical protein